MAGIMLDWVDWAISESGYWAGHNRESDFFGLKVTWIASEIGVGLHFNALVPFEDRVDSFLEWERDLSVAKVIKYGVIGTEEIKEDLLGFTAPSDNEISITN